MQTALTEIQGLANRIHCIRWKRLNIFGSIHTLSVGEGMNSGDSVRKCDDRYGAILKEYRLSEARINWTKLGRLNDAARHDATDWEEGLWERVERMEGVVD